MKAFAKLLSENVNILVYLLQDWKTHKIVNESMLPVLVSLIFINS